MKRSAHYAEHLSDESCKFVLEVSALQMPDEHVTAIGQIDRIGLSDSIFAMKSESGKVEKNQTIQNHTEVAFVLLEMLISEGIVGSFDEIDGIGHRVVHGGEVFSDSVLITDEIVETLQGLSNLAPLHNPANIVGIKEFMKALPNVPAIAVFDTAFHQTMPESSFLYPYRMSIMKNMASENTASMAQAISM